MKFFKSFLFVYLRFVIIGFAAVLFVESGVLIYINNVYLRDNDNYKSKTIAVNSSKAIQLKKVDIDEGATNATGSNDMRYTAYQKDGVITVVDISNGQKYTVQSASKMQVSYFKWIYNTDRMIIAEKNTTGNYIKLYYFDMKDKALTEIRDNTNDEDIKIDLDDKNDNVTDIDMSTEVVKTYVKVTGQNKRSAIWEVDANDPNGSLDSLDNIFTSNIGAIQSLKLADKLLYEDNNNGRVYLYGSKTALSADGSTSLGLLGFDSSDNVYLADTGGGSTKTIYCGSYDGNNNKWNSWTTIRMNKAVPASDIYVELNGYIYVDDKASSSIVKAWTASNSSQTSSTASSKVLSSAKSTSSSGALDGIKYDGKVISVCKNGFLTIYNNQIIPYEFE